MAAMIVPTVTPVPTLCHPNHFTARRHCPTTTRNHHSSAVTLVRWTPPPPGCFKLNFDGSVLHDGSGRASIGGVLRDCTGQIVFAYAVLTDHAPIGEVEATALICGLDLVLGSGGFISNCPLLIEGDDLTLVRLLRGELRQTRMPLAMEEQIMEMLGQLRGGFQVQHIYREGNQVADKLTKEAYRCPGVWMDPQLVPAGVREKADDDRHGVLHQRIRVR